MDEQQRIQQVQELQAELNQLRATHEFLETRHQALRTRRSQDIARATQALQDGWRADREQAAELRREEHARAHQIELNRRRLRDERNAIRAERDELQEQIAELQGQREADQNALTELRDQTNTLQQRAEQAEEGLAAAQSREGALRHQLDEVQQQIREQREMREERAMPVRHGRPVTEFDHGIKNFLGLEAVHGRKKVTAGLEHTYGKREGSNILESKVMAGVRGHLEFGSPRTEGAPVRNGEGLTVESMLFKGTKGIGYRGLYRPTQTIHDVLGRVKLPGPGYADFILFEKVSNKAVGSQNPAMPTIAHEVQPLPVRDISVDGQTVNVPDTSPTRLVPTCAPQVPTNHVPSGTWMSGGLFSLLGLAVGCMSIYKFYFGRKKAK